MKVEFEGKTYACFFRYGLVRRERELTRKVGPNRVEKVQQLTVKRAVECQIVLDKGAGKNAEKLSWGVAKTSPMQPYVKVELRKGAYLEALYSITDPILRKALGNAFGLKMKFSCGAKIKTARAVRRTYLTSQVSTQKFPVLVETAEPILTVETVKTESGEMAKTYS